VDKEVLNQVILVNEFDEEIGTMEKLEAHQKGLLHRAFSVFVFNTKKELLLQKRALGKYHSEGLWTNTCCSHPSPGESIEEAAVRRLMEEMGYSCTVFKSFSFIYDVALDNDLIEHELDHVVIGISDNNPILNPAEASAFEWKSIETIKNEMDLFPDNYTSWFKIILNEHNDKLVKALNLAYESL
jgi:isopentenyl-diphosphate delta-isomerase